MAVELKEFAIITSPRGPEIKQRQPNLVGREVKDRRENLAPLQIRMGIQACSGAGTGALLDILGSLSRLGPSCPQQQNGLVVAEPNRAFRRNGNG